METLLSYLTRSVLISGLLLGYYALALRDRKLHSFNRVWLLMTLLASATLPLIRVDWLTWHRQARQPLEALIAGTATHAAVENAFPVMTVALLSAGTVSLALLLILGLRIALVYRLKRRHPRQLLEGCCLIEVRDQRAPFTFLHNLFWQKGADIQDPIQRKILDHELAHIRGGHTYDTVFTQALAAVFWMNPFFWLIRRELQMVHEFIADDSSIAAGDTETFALMLLRTYDDGRYLDPAKHFFHSPIKRRLHMINASRPPSGLRKTLALSVLLAGMALACSKEQSLAPSTFKFKTTYLSPFITKDSIKVRIVGKLNTIYFQYKTREPGSSSSQILENHRPAVPGQVHEIRLDPQPITVVGQIIKD